MEINQIILLISAVTTAVIAIMTPILAFLIKRLEARQAANGAAAVIAKASTDGQLKEIHTLVNSTLSASQTTNVALVKQVADQKEMITRLTPPPDSVLSLTQKLQELQAEMAHLRAGVPAADPNKKGD